MGEPLPGQIVDNIFVSIDQLDLAATQVGKAGDILVQEIAGSGFFIKAATAAVLDQGWGQARVDYDSTGLANGELEIEVMTPPSKMYVTAGGVINPGDYVKLDATGQKFVKASELDIEGGLVAGRYEKKAGTSIATPCADTNIIIIKTGVGM